MMKDKINKRKIIYALIALALIASITFIIWLNLNPENGRKFTEKVVVVVFMAVFFWVGWFFMRVGKKE